MVHGTLHVNGVKCVTQKRERVSACGEGVGGWRAGGLHNFIFTATRALLLKCSLAKLSYTSCVQSTYLFSMHNIVLHKFKIMSTVFTSIQVFIFSRIYYLNGFSY